jgi:hypothetical protein
LNNAFIVISELSKLASGKTTMFRIILCLLAISLLTAADGSLVAIPVLSDATLTVIDDLSSGIQAMDGIDWQISNPGIGLNAEHGPSVAIPVGQKAHRLHLLHTLVTDGPGLQKVLSKYLDKNKIDAHPPQTFGYELTYADGRTYVLHMDWMHHIALLDLAKTPDRLYNSQPLPLPNDQQVYHCIMPNPYPDQMISSIRLLPPEKGGDMGTPVLLGLATETLQPVSQAGQQWGCADYSCLHGLSWVQVDGDQLLVPLHNKSDRAALAYLAEPVSGDFRFQARLLDIPIYAKWGSVGLSARSAVIYGGRGGLRDAVSVFFKPVDSEIHTKEGIFYHSNGTPIAGGVVLGEAKPIVRIDPAEATTATPIWLALERRGQHFIAQQSNDGQSWQTVGETDWSDAPASLYLTIPTAMSHIHQLAYARLDQISVSQ